MASAALTFACNPLTHLLDRIKSHLHIVVTALIAAILIPWVRGNYKAFLALGRGGLPANPLGYSLAMIAMPFSKETTSTACYEKDEDKTTWLRDPDTIPERRGERPKIGWHSLPQRQVNRFPSQQVKEKIDAIFVRHAAVNSDVVDVVTSPHERIHDAMVIASSVPSPHKVADHAIREIAHLHPQIDYSMHLVLSPQDCKLVIERGWGERHPLSGTRLLPKQFILTYAPRDDEELDVVERIIVASIGYMTGKRDVN